MTVASVESGAAPARRRWSQLPVMGRLVALGRDRMGRAGLIAVGLLVLAAWLGPSILPAPTTGQNLAEALQSPSAEHWLGTDQAGRDVAVRLLQGMRTSWALVLVGTLIGLGLGLVAGVAAGARRRIVEPVVLRLLDVVLAVPNIVLALLIAALLGAGSTAVTVALAARAFPVFARVAHVGTRSVMGQEFVQSAKVLGAGPGRILGAYVLPNVVAPCIALLPVLFGGGLLIAASLSFFGVGVQAPNAELGLLVADGQQYMHLAPMLIWAPGVLLLVNNLALSALGAGVRRALDPVQQQAIGNWRT